MPHAHAHPLDHAIHTATEWVDAVAAQFGTEDHQFVHRVIRAWLHGVRDRLAVVEAVHLGAQLPELLRGIYYEGWDPLAVPVRCDAEQFAARFADEAGVSMADVPKIVWAVSTAFAERLSSWNKVLGLMPADVRALLKP